VNFEMIVGIPLLIKAIILCIQNILEVLLEDIRILTMDLIFLHKNITIIPHSVFYVSPSNRSKLISSGIYNFDWFILGILNLTFFMRVGTKL